MQALDKVKAAFFRGSVLVMLLLAVFAIVFETHKTDVQADDQGAAVKSINISPASFEVDGQDAEGWQHGEQAVVNELAEGSIMSEFTQDNSAYLAIGDLSRLAAEIVDKPTAEVAAEANHVLPETTGDASTAATESTEPASLPPTAEPSIDVVESAQSEQPAAAETPLASDSTEPATEVNTADQPSGQATEPAADAVPNEPQPMPVLVEHSIILKDFSLPPDFQGGSLTNTQLRMSLAAKQVGARDQLKIYFRLGEAWQDAGLLDFKNEVSNQTNNGFFLFALPIFASLDDLKNLQVKVVFLGDPANSAAEVFLDAAWLEVDYQPTGSGEELKAAQQDVEPQIDPAEQLVTLISPETTFKTFDNPDFNFIFQRKSEGVGGFISSLLGTIIDQYSDLDIRAELLDGQDRPVEMPIDIIRLDDGEFNIRLNRQKHNFRPGKYRLAVKINDGAEEITKYQEFSWGVLAINPNKSVYLPTEEAALAMAVLDENGDTICDADLFLEITAPDGGVAYLDTYNGLIQREPACGPNNVIDVPDYTARYGLGGAGVYRIKLTAHTANGDEVITDQFEVREQVPFDVERTGPTRIWPWANYRMQLAIKANESYFGDVVEVVPANFIITSQRLELNGSALSDGGNYRFLVESDGSDGHLLKWQNLQLQPGDRLSVIYEFDAPDVSPEYYLLGSARVGDFTEARLWQIASDAIGTYNATGGTATGWTNAALAWNGSNNQYASKSIAAGSFDSANALRATTNAAVDMGGFIQRVEIGFEGYYGVNAASKAVITRPILNGVATGTSATTTITTADTSYYIDVTNATSSWTWADIQNLDVMLHGYNYSGQARTLYIDRIMYRITYNLAPTGVINSASQKLDGSGLVDLSAQIADIDGDQAKVMVEYVAGANCNFAVPQDPTIATTGTSSTFGTFIVDNDAAYQIGTTTATSSSVYTASGTNTINFDWDSQADLPGVEGVYCIRLTASDAYSNQATSSLATTTLDNIKPVTPGNLTLATTSNGNEVRIGFGATSSDTNFREYKIFYKIGTSGVTEADEVIDQGSDINLAAASFNGATSTLLSDLLPRTDYVFNIWAYDQYGNIASATEVTITTEKAAPQRANTVNYYAGQWSANGTNGQLTDTDQTLPAFNFALAESGAKVQNAYVMFEINYDSYANVVATTSGYKLAFDACQAPCTANAFAGTGRVLNYDNTVLAYHATANGGNTQRLLLDVTKEAQLASYAGNGQLLQGQVGYRIENGIATNSISIAKAQLFVTYRYNDKLSMNQTNTVVYPLESTNGGDTGTRRAAIVSNCIKNSTCPVFNYNLQVPEIATSVSQWFEISSINGGGTVNDINSTVNIQGYDTDSAAYIHESVLGSGQSGMLPQYFNAVFGFSPNTAQQLEQRMVNTTPNVNIYLLGGEVKNTYFASTTAAIKTRTAYFPIGVINYGGTDSTNKRSGTVNIVFPENSLATGTVSIKKAWVRIRSNYYNTAARTLNVWTKVGSNAESAQAQYAGFLMSTLVPNTDFGIIHVIPQSDYARLETANSVTTIPVTVSTQYNLAVPGGTSAEVVVTYTYTSEAGGRLSSLTVFGGQQQGSSSLQLATSSGMKLVLPEAPTTKTILAGGLLANYFLNDSDYGVPAANFMLDANLSTSSVPTCNNSFYVRPDGINDFTSFYKDVTASLSTENNASIYTCYSNNGGADTSAGAKASGQLIYTYRYDAPPASLRQNEWRWYANEASTTPSQSKADENQVLNDVNRADVLRLRLNAYLFAENMGTGTQAFKLQYGLGDDCAAIVSWADVGTTASTAPWRGFDNASLNDGESEGQALLTSSDKFQSYEEESNSVGNPRSLVENQTGEWDWVVYNNLATSSQSYCFRMAKPDGSPLYGYDSYPRLVTAASNTAPVNPFDLTQSKNGTTTQIANGDWLNVNIVRLGASTTDVNINQALRLYIQLATSTPLLTATTVPVGACNFGISYAACASRVWVGTSSVGDYRFNPYATSVSVTLLPENYATGYSWQALACDSFNACSDWTTYGAQPNFKVDLTAPTRPGALTEGLITPTSITVAFGAAANEANFDQYKIFYKKGTTSVKETDLLWYDESIMASSTYGSATSTTITGLTAGTTYVFNIWAYDLAGNRSSSSVELISTTTSSYTPPFSSLTSASQKTDGSGGVDIVFMADDPDNDDTVRARIEYEAGSACVFSTPNKIYLDPTDEKTEANYGDPKVDNNAYFQVGTTSGWIMTSQNANYVATDWLSKQDLDGAEGTYCLRLVVNDGMFSQTGTTTKLITLDNKAPTDPGALSLVSKTHESLLLGFGSSSIETNFSHYRIYYATTSPVTEADMELSDPNLGSKNYNLAATTSLAGLDADTDYYIKIWAYDIFGNRASSTELLVRTDAIPQAPTTTGQFVSYSTTSIANGGWITEAQISLVGAANDADADEILTMYYQLVRTASTSLTATSVPANACATTTAFTACTSSVWAVVGQPADYSIVPFMATATIAGLPESASGYKWQIMACDDDGACSSWQKFDATAPNFKVDTVAPTAPGALSYNSKTSASVTLNFGASTTESNFSHYRLFYSTSSPVTEADYEQADPSLNYANFNGASMVTVESLSPNTQYYFSLWAYDQGGLKASSSVVSVTTNPMQSTPGVMFYARASSTLYYRIWNGTAWGPEKVGPNMGTVGTQAVRHISTLTSDDRGKIAVLVKSYAANSQQWWATVYRMAADDFVNTQQLGATYANAAGAGAITGCIASLSGGEFFVVRNNNGTANPGTLVYKWAASNGWTAQGNGPNPTSMGYGCALIRRPNTDNYLLSTFDARPGVGTAYYIGTGTYSNSWTNWNQVTASNEYNTANYVGDGFFDPGDNTRGAFYSGTGAANTYLQATRFTNSTSTITYGAATTTPAGANAWSYRATQGQFAADPGQAGIAYFIGRDASTSATYSTLNVYKLDITNNQPIFTTVTNGKFINASTTAYGQANYSQKPFDMAFYKNNNALVSWTLNVAGAPRFKKLDALANSIDSASSTVPGASTTAIWNRVRFYKDPNEIQLLSVYQNTAREYGAIFWDGGSSQFFNSGSQAWFTFATTSGVYDADDSATSFSFTAGNSAPSTPVNLAQFKSNGTTTLANGTTTNESTAVFRLAAKDPDTSERVALYLQVLDLSGTFSSSSTVPSSPCASTTTYALCAGKIWFIASSTAGDYSINAFTATATITNIPDNVITSGYKWQVLACDDSGACSNWTEYNPSQPNFKVDTTRPTDPGNLAVAYKTSNSITLAFGASSTEDNFLTYRIFYKSGSAGVTEASTPWVDANLAYKNYNNATSTTVTGLASSTIYYFRIWAYDQAGNKASSSAEIATTTSSGPSIHQVSYVFENDSGVGVNFNATSTNASTSLANIAKGERLAARIQFENRGGDVLANKAYKLQFENQTDSPGTWTDVSAASAISLSGGLSGATGNPLTGYKAAANANTWMNGAWYSSTNQTGSLTLAKTTYTEVAFMLQTYNAAIGKTYRLRLFNMTDNKVLDGYANYPILSMAATDARRFSKGTYASLPTSYTDATYYFDRLGYANVATDNSVYDVATSANAYPVMNFLVKNATDTQAITPYWNGQSSVGGATKPVYLQIYRFGTTNAWVTIASTSTSTANTDFALSATVNAKLGEYYDAFNFAYWRVYQESGSQTLRTDYATTTFAAPVPFVSQLHYRWRENNGNETTAAWLEAEDLGSPTASSSVAKGQVVRLRMSAANLGGGAALNYRYQIEYASTSMGCAVDTGAWFAVPTDSSREFRMSTTTTFADQANTTKQLADSEGYAFSAGKMTRDPSNKTASTTLLEGQYQENEYAFFATANAIDGATYCFRMTKDGVPLDDYGIIPEMTLAGNSNTAPAWDTHPDDGGSGTSSPTHSGDILTFSAQAIDAEGDDYYLAICQGTGITPGNNAPPTCQKGNWCVSGLASSSDPVSCDYTVATSTEIANWFGYVCDNRPGVGVAKCAAVSQGNSGSDGDAPFFVNHRPTFTAVVTLNNNLDPGGTTTIRTTAVDTDMVDGQDLLSLTVCKAPGLSGMACAVASNTVCQINNATTTNVSCDYPINYGSPSGVTTYYAYVFDSHGLDSASNYRSNTITVNNAMPTFGTLVINGGDEITLNLKNAPDRVVAASTTVTDLNGCADLLTFPSLTYMSATTSSCWPNSNDCYNASCAITDCSGGTDTTAVYTCTSSLKYNAIPTDGDGSNGNPWHSYGWMSRVQVRDGNNWVGSAPEPNYKSATSSPVDVYMSEGLLVYQQETLHIIGASINFGSTLRAGDDTGAINQVVSIANIGNAPIDGDMYGDDMVGNPSGVLPATQMKWNLTGFTYSSGGINLSNNQLAMNSVPLNLPRATTTATSSKPLYWGIRIPFGADSSAYSGVNYLYSKLYSSGWQ